MGFIGALLVILLFAYLIYRGFRVARRRRINSARCWRPALPQKLAIQTLMNLFVVTGIIPVTGAALPFFSYERHGAAHAARRNGDTAEYIAVYADRRATKNEAIGEIRFEAVYHWRRHGRACDARACHRAVF